MKIRNGFVSNSSSASFVIKWINVRDPEASIEDSLKLLFPPDCRNAIEKRIIQTVINKTKKEGSIFITEDYVNMYNTVFDYNEDLLLFHAKL